MRNKVIIISTYFLVLSIGGTLGYMYLEGTGFWMGLYLTVMTVFTVGYGDVVPVHPAGRAFTVLLVLSSVSFVMYTFSKITETMLEGELRGLYRRRRMQRLVDKFKNHYIVCGYGKIGKEICTILAGHHRDFVIIEKDADEVKIILDLGYPLIQGDATHDNTLLLAGINQAKGLISAVDSDADNVYITLTARGLNSQLFILARSSGSTGVHNKLMQAGASKVVSPNSIGARRMAHLIVRPTVSDFIDLTMRTGELDLVMDELQVGTDSLLNGKNLIESEIRKKYDVIVVAIKRRDGGMLFNPRPDTIIMAEDTLVVLGENDHITSLATEL